MSVMTTFDHWKAKGPLTTEEYAMSVQSISGLLAALLLVAFAASPVSAQGEKKSGQSCYQKCNSEVPLSERQRDKQVKACVMSCRAGH
jgi:hypothetical protein